MADDNAPPTPAASAPVGEPHPGEAPVGDRPPIRAGNSTGPQRWTPPPVEEAVRLFPSYEVLAMLGCGGMGAVYQARQPALDRLVAIKLLPLEVSADQGFAERFRREARALARLSHPNIVAVHDFGQTAAGHLFFVMEFVDGSNLRELMQRGELSNADALRVLVSVCEALAYAHGQGIVHRDIKPANVLVDRQGRVKVADFGLARFTDAPVDWSVTTTGTIMGTPDYMAPEQRHGMKVDHRADIYSLGVMLYETLAGEIPKGVFDPLSRRIGTDKRLDQIVSRALSQQPEKRFQSSDELKTAIELVRPAVLKAARHRAKHTPPQKLVVTPGPNGPGAAPAPIAPDAPTIANTVFIFPRRRFIPQSPAWRWTAAALATLVLAASGWYALNKKPVATQPARAVHSAVEPASPYVNSLGMRFVPVPILDGAGARTPLLFCVWETREQDYLPFVKERDVPWPKQNFRSSTHPAANMTWEEAQAFCEWLTEREQRSGGIAASQRYRLPTDHEWSCAVGIGDREDPARAPEEKQLKIADVFPWGTAWPPPYEAGNYSGEEAAGSETWVGQKVLPGYRDAFPASAPVGSFPANRLGLFDLGGNLHEWCEDLFGSGQQSQVLRGGSFVNHSRENLLSSYRLNRPPDERSQGYGFRVVLDGAFPARRPGNVPGGPSPGEPAKEAGGRKNPAP